MYHIILFCLLLPIGVMAQQDSLSYQLNKTKWKTTKIAPGVRWQRYHFDRAELFRANQNINLLRIKKRHRALELEFGSGGQALLPTSKQGKQNGAFAALNGTFFDVKQGGSVDLIRIDGVTLDTTRPSGKFLAEHQRSALLIRANQLHILAGDSLRGWDKALQNEPNVMVTGPLLLHQGQVVALSRRPFNTTRHPRTAVGLTRKGEMLWITVDGRASEAAGMNLFELRQFMQALGCVEAINLDGGGSTTLWLDGQTSTGVVNMPCDDKVFDEYGERKVSNVLLLSRRRKTLND